MAVLWQEKVIYLLGFFSHFTNKWENLIGPSYNASVLSNLFELCNSDDDTEGWILKHLKGFQKRDVKVIKYWKMCPRRYYVKTQFDY